MSGNAFTRPRKFSAENRLAKEFCSPVLLFSTRYRSLSA